MKPPFPAMVVSPLLGSLVTKGEDAVRYQSEFLHAMSQLLDAMSQIIYAIVLLF